MAAHPTPLLAGFVLGDLDVHERELVEVHLLTCSQCRAEVAALRDALFSLPDTLPTAPVPEGAWERLQARRNAGTDRPTVLSRRSVPLWPLVAAVGLGLLLGGLGTQTYLKGQQQVENQSPALAGAQPLRLVNSQGKSFGTVLFMPDMQALIVLDQRPPGGQVYQVWGRPREQGGVVKAVSLGMTEGTSLKVIRCNSYEFVGVSLEPVGGNAAPTHPLGRVKVPLKGT